MEKVDCVVIGAGVVGLAIAREAALAGREVIIVEQHNAIGTETSARNSEVIHAGIYYPAGSLKAQLCVRGKHMLYEFCESHQVAHRRCGKLLVATDDNQIHDGAHSLAAIQKKAQANGVNDLTWLTRDEAQAMEPKLQCVAALFSPSTGIIDTHGYMLALLGDAEARGAMLALESPVLHGQCSNDGIELHTPELSVRAKTVFNSAGLHAPGLAGKLARLPRQFVPPAFYAKGNYYSLSGKSPFTRLVYPMPNEAGLGVHLTLDLGGQARFGPDVEWIDAINYDVDIRRADSFYAAIRQYWPELQDAALQPGYAGIRPKIAGPEDKAADFVIQGPQVHGVPGLLNLFGIESPGITASLALAQYAYAHVQA